MKIKLLLLVPFIILIASFKNRTENTVLNNVATQNLNISFLLDLSDRIDPKKHPNPTMQYYQRDLQYIKSVQKAFTDHIKRKKIMLLNDQMQVFFDPAPKDPAINKLSQQLKVNFNRASSKKDIENVAKIFSEVPSKIYQSAIGDRHFIGSDIWRFFKKKVKDYCIKDKHRNILVIITDGYMYHPDSKFGSGNKSSYLTPAFIKARKLTTANYTDLIKKSGLGFIPATNGLNNLEVLVLGINASKNNPFEEDVINQYWTDWFKAMNVKKSYLKSADLPSNLDPVIQNIIANKY